MHAPPRTRSEEEARGYPDGSIRASHEVIVKICLGAGMDAVDAEDLAQDLWEWMIRTGVPAALLATPWLKAAVRNYVLRFRRRSICRGIREGRSLETIAEPQSPPPLGALETNELLDRIATVLPKTEGRMLALIRLGHTIADAARMLKIPTGSRDYHKDQIIAYARRHLQRENVIPIVRA